MKVLRVTGMCVLALTMAAHAMAQKPAKVKVHIDADVNPWTHLNLNNNPENFQFAIVSDRTGGHREGVFQEGISKMHLLQPEFVMSVGDLIEGGIEDLAEIDRQWAEFNSFVEQLKMPFFYVPGNHDISNEVMYKEWNRRFGRSYYHFVYRDVLFLCLNTEDPPRTQMSADQAAYVKKALDENKKVRWTLVFMHKPMWTYEQDTGWGAIESLLQGRPYTVFAGHTHDYTKYLRKDQRYIVLATTGGSSGLRGKAFGEFDQVAWVTMTDDGPILANLMLDGIWDEDIYTAEHTALLRPALSGAAVRFDPVVVEGKTFSTAPAKLRIRNDSDVPMQAVVTLNATKALQPSVVRVDKSLPPNSVELVDVLLTSPDKMPVDMIAPMKVDWSLTYQLTDKAPVEVSGAYRLVVESSYPIPRQQAAVSVDGKLDEWTSLPFACIEPAALVGGEQWWSGTGDASHRFSVTRDDKFVYVAVAVTDDLLRCDVSRRPASQDGVEIWIDARPDGQRNVMPGNEAGKEFIQLVLAPGYNTSGGATESVGWVPEGTHYACAATDTGFAVEVAVPVAYFNGLQNGKWNALRLNICQNDTDAEYSGPKNNLWWRHDWRSPANVPNSGTFVVRK